MPTNPVLGIDAALNLDQWSRGVDALLMDDPKIRKAMQRIADAADDAEKALNDIRGDVNVNVTVQDGDLRTAKGLHDDLNENTSSTAQMQAEDIAEARDLLEEMRNIKVIEIGLEIGGKAMEFLTNPEEAPVLSTIIEIDSALHKVEGTTGRMIPGAEHLINDLYINNWGESREAIANVIIEANNLKIANEDLAEATLAAFETQTVTGGETNEILRSMDSLVKNDLVSSYSDAADIIVTGFQNGADRGQDLLDTLNEYGSTFKELRISGEGALSLINSGLDAGIDNSDRIADALRETGIRLREMGTDPNIKAAFDRLDSLSDIDLAASFDAFNAGEITGDEFFDGFFTALADANAVDPAAASTIAATLVGTISEDFGPTVISQLSPQWDDAMGVLEGRAERSANTISDTLGGSLTSLRRTVESELVSTIDETFDIDGLIEKIKTAVATLGTELRSGAGLGEAIEVAFQIPGFEENLDRLASILGNFALAIGDLAGDFARLTGNTQLADSIHDALLPLAQGQLEFDLGLANTREDVVDAVQQAANRGISLAVQKYSMEQAIQDAIDSGDYDVALTIANAPGEGSALEGQFADEAQAATDAANAAFSEALAGNQFDAAGAIATQLGDPLLLQIVQTMQQAQAETAAGMNTLRATVNGNGLNGLGERAAGPAGAPSERGPEGMSAGAIGNSFFDQVSSAAAAMDLSIQTVVPNVSQSIDTINLGMIAVGATAQEHLPLATNEFATLAESIITGFTPVNALLQGTLDLMDMLGAGGSGTGGGASGGTGGQTPSHDSGGWLHEGEYTTIGGEGFVSPGDAYALGLPNQSMMSRYDLVGGAMGGGGTTNHHSKNISVNNNFNVSSPAEAIMTGDRVSAQLRGYN